MSALGDLLLAEEPLFTESLKQLEQRSGHQGVDLQLIAELATRSASMLGALGLSPLATAEEAFEAQMKAMADANIRMAQIVGAPDDQTLATLTPKLVEAVEAANIDRRCFALKESVAAEMLRQTPPKAIMQRLGYSSVDDMLRHEDLGELFVALRFAETPAWLVQFNAQYHTITADDFETRTIRIVIFDAAKWGDVAEHFVQKKLHNLTHSKEMGVVGVVPTTVERMTGAPLKMLPMLLHYHNEIRLYTAYFKLISQKTNFGEVLGRTLIAGTPKVSIHADQHIHWRVIQRYFAKLGDEKHPEIFQPHVQPEDLHWRATEDTLYEIDPQLASWRGTDYVGHKLDGGVIGYNLMDAAFGYSNGLAFKERYLYHFRESLWNELFSRYMGSEVLRQQILERLDNEIIKPEEL